VYKKIALVVLIAGALGASAAGAAQCNYDVTNTSYETPYDLAIAIPGHWTFTEFWDNIGDGSPTVTYYTTPSPVSMTTTWVHWVKTPAAPIVHGEKVHVGYTVSGFPGCPPMAHLYWTDKDGNIMEAAYVGIAENHLTGTSVKITNVSTQPIQVVDVRMACQKEALALGALNATNEYLARAMVSIADSPAGLAPGESWEIPVRIPCKQCYCVTNFKTTGDGLSAIFSPWVQEFVGDASESGGSRN
jgi:hypothetical protein